MESLIQGLLELSRVQRVEIEPAEVALSQLVEDIGRQLETTYPKASVAVGSLPVVWMNALRARQLFTNLIENALKHGEREDMTVRISARAAEEGATEISIADDGRGVPALYREKVFGVFERLEGPGGDGTGIGLSICRKIVEHLGGRIWIADSANGADIRIELPAGAVLGWGVEART